MATTYHEHANSMTAAPTMPVLASEIEQVLPNEAHQMLRSLEKAFGQSFTVIECTTGHVLRDSPSFPAIDLETRLTACADRPSRSP